MKRRVFITLLGGAASWPLTVYGQQTERSIVHPCVAFLGAESLTTNRHFLDAFRDGMAEHGYVNGQNITLVDRWAEGRIERFPELIRDLIADIENFLRSSKTFHQSRELRRPDSGF